MTPSSPRGSVYRSPPTASVSSRSIRMLSSRATLLPPERNNFDVLVVGAGFAGSVCARRMAEDYGLRVLVIDRRPHVAGNAHDALDEHGVLIHTYGPHIFHTNADKVIAFLSRFTDWHPYEHRVWASVDGRIIPMPINRNTIRALHGVDLRNDDDTAAYLASL